MRDRGTRLLLTAPSTDKGSASVVSALKHHYVDNFDVPTAIITDNGQDLKTALRTLNVSEEWKCAIRHVSVEQQTMCKNAFTSSLWKADETTGIYVFPLPMRRFSRR